MPCWRFALSRHSLVAFIPIVDVILCRVTAHLTHSTETIFTGELLVSCVRKIQAYRCMGVLGIKINKNKHNDVRKI